MLAVGGCGTNRKLIGDAYNVPCEDCPKECCLSTDGTVALATELAEAATETFVLSTFTISGLDFNALMSNPETQAAIKDKVLVRFQKTMGEDNTYVITFSKGSVITNVKITAPAGSDINANSIKTPPAADILSELKTIPSIQAVTIPGQTIGVTAVKANHFKKGETKATTVAAPPPPPSPTASPSPSPATTGESETDGAICATAMTSLILAAGALSLFA
jgi:hypothetical protein